MTLTNFTPAEEQIFKTIAEAAAKLNQPAYIIGGYVRDKILGRPSKDVDVVCLGDGIALAAAVAEMLGPKPTVAFFKTYGTAQIKTEGLEIEFVGARKESYSENSRNPEVEAGTLADDQNRRDFTINALAISLAAENFGELNDPFGGLQDLENKTLRTPLEPGITFSDDPLRMMRCARFATQLAFEIEPKTKQALAENSKRISIITKERITDELNKIIAAPVPSVGFKILFDAGILKQIFPQMTDLAGVEIVQGKGHKDNFYHTLQVLDNTAQRSPKLWLRWAAILHDIAKPATKKFEPGHGWTFHGHDAVGARMVKTIFRNLKLPLGEEMRYVAKLVMLHLRPISLSKDEITDAAMRRLLFDAGEDLEDLMMLCESDITSKNQEKVKRYLANFALVKERLAAVEESDKMRAWRPPVDGEEIMELFGLKPSREVGALKSALQDAILDGEIENTREASLAFLRARFREMGS